MDALDDITGDPHPVYTNAKVQEDGSIVYPLLKPVTITLKGPQGERSETVTRVTLNEPTGKHLRGLDRVTGQQGRGLYMVGCCSGLNEAQVDRLGTRDLAALNGLAEDFFPDGPATGTTVSGA